MNQRTTKDAEAECGEHLTKGRTAPHVDRQLLTITVALNGIVDMLAASAAAEFFRCEMHRSMVTPDAVKTKRQAELGEQGTPGNNY